MLERLSLAVEYVGAAENGDARTANEQLSRVIEELESVLEALAGDRQASFSDGAVAARKP